MHQPPHKLATFRAAAVPPLVHAIELILYLLEALILLDALEDWLVGTKIDIRVFPKWWLPRQQLERSDANRPDVNLWCVRLKANHLWSNVGCCSHQRICARFGDASKPKIYQLAICAAQSLCVSRQHHVSRLDIAVHNPTRVAVLQRSEQLANQASHKSLRRRRLTFCYQLITAATWQILKNQDELLSLCVLCILVKLHYSWVVQRAE
mmetsp:Transcript_139377/g.240860  ORF Transcript_139377/g.240860 Transcript_139377/m.240860 type:complete len:208 (-) Transcript_139377:15-638(-)